MNAYQVLSALGVASLMAACGGGGGGGGVGGAGGGGAIVRPTPQFTSFAAVQANSSVSAQAVSRTADIMLDSNELVIGGDVRPVDTSGSSTQLTYDGNRDLIGVAVSTPAGSGSFLNGRGNEKVDCSGTLCTATSNEGFISGVDPEAFGWSFQTFGIWERDITETSGMITAVSLGAPTAPAGIPTAGQATYSGATHGINVDATGNAYAHLAELSATADFANRSITLSTFNTNTVSVSTGTREAAPHLNLSGTLTYAAGSNSFSGPVSATGMTGTADGRFYGPAAQEMGGVYALTGSNALQGMIGGFGAKR